SHSALSFDPRGASETLRPREIRFVCLVPREFERVALVLKQQLEAVGVQLDLREISLENLDEALLTVNFDAALTDFVSGPSVFRLYYMWHSQGLFKGRVGSRHLDEAL